MKVILKVAEEFETLDYENKKRPVFIAMLEEALSVEGEKLICGKYAVQLAKKQGFKTSFTRGAPIKFNKK